MSALLDTLKKAWDERAKINRWFLMNASANRNVPWQDTDPINVNVVHTTDPPPKHPDPPAPPPAPSITVQPAPVVIMPAKEETKPPATPPVVPAPATPTTAIPTWVKVLGGIALLVVTAGSAAAIANYFRGPTTNTTTVEGDRSVLQYLEDGQWNVK